MKRPFFRRAPARSLFVWALCAHTLGLAAPAWAQQPGAAAPSQAPTPEVVPPRIVRDPGAQYPEQALQEKLHDTFTVVLKLTVDAQGKVTAAEADPPVGHGFDEAAVAAAMELELEPAKVRGVAKAARILHRYVFAPPPARLRGNLANRRTGSVPRDAQVIAVRQEDGQEYQAQIEADGSYRFGELPPGEYLLRASARGFVTEQSREQLEPATETVASLSLSREEPIEPADAAAQAPSDPTAPAEQDFEEITVRGKRPAREVTKRTLEQRELSRIPGSNGDALRALQNLPGVARPPGLAGLLIVRGASPNETAIFIDGTPVPIVYHFGGLSSVVPTEMLEKIDFYPGNFSSQYGRVTGGVVDVSIKDPTTKRLRGLAQVDLIDARLMVEGPIGKGWSFAVGARRSHVDSWLGPVLNAAGAGVTTAPVYYDYQAMLHKKIDAKQSLRFLFMGSDDRLSMVVKSSFGGAPAATGSVGLGTAFYRFQARYENRFNDDTSLKMVGAFGKDALQFNLGDQYFNLDSYPASVRTELSHRVASGVRANVGIDWLYTYYDIGVRLPPIPSPGEPPGGPFGSQQQLTVQESGTQYRPGAYQELELTPWKGARIIPGTRLDYSKDTKKWDFSPRLVARQELPGGPRRTTLKGGLGVFRQPPQPFESNAIFGQNGLSSNRATHYSLGFERELTKQIELSVEGFYRDLDNLVVSGRGNAGSGRAFGAETLLRYKPDERFFGFIAYTLSRSTRRDADGEAERLFAYDQTHILTALGSYRLGRGWEVGARFRLVSGSMITPQQYGFFDQNAGSYLPISYPLNGQRMPFYHQLDVRVDKTWTFPTWKLAAYLDLWNSYNAPNVEGISYNYNSSRSVYGSSIPIIPSIGLRGEL